MIVDVLAAFRITSLIVNDQLLEPARNRIWVKHPPEQHGLGFIVSCPYCSSMWVAVAVVAARRFAPKQWQPVAEMLALSALAGEAAARLGH